MSSIGKILIVVNVVLSVFFLGFASHLVYKSGNYKQKFDEEKQAHNLTKEESGGTVSDLQAQVTDLQKVNDSLRHERDRYMTDADTLRNALEQEKQVNAQLRGSVDGINANIDNYRVTIQDLHNQLTKVQKEKEKFWADRDSAIAAKEKAEAEWNDAVARMKKAQTQYEDLREGAEKAIKERDSLDSKLKTLLAITNVSLDEIQSQPQIDGRVVEVAEDLGLVAFNVGKAQGVEPGFSFDIFQGENYKGKAVVDTVEDNYCSARITLRVPGQVIEKGDQATTRL